MVDCVPDQPEFSKPFQAFYNNRWERVVRFDGFGNEQLTAHLESRSLRIMSTASGTERDDFGLAVASSAARVFQQRPQGHFLSTGLA
jgi:hypothetical protein